MRLLPPVRHRIATCNLWEGNHDPSSGAVEVISASQSALGYGPDALCFQETRRQRVRDSLRRVAGHRLLEEASDGEASLELAVLLPDHLHLLGTEYRHCADGVRGGNPVLDHPRGAYVVKYLKRRQRVAVVNTHMGVIGDELLVEERLQRDPSRPMAQAATQHRGHALAVAHMVVDLRKRGFETFVTADANSRGKWEWSLPAVLGRIGMEVTRDGVDIVARFPGQARGPVRQTVVDRSLTGSDAHDALVVESTQRHRQD